MGEASRKVLVVGSGIAGLSAAICAAERGLHVVLVSPYASERAQSVMAAGGINAALDTMGENDSIALHVRETLAGGCFLENPATIEAFCSEAPDIVRWLESIGVVFSRRSDGEIAQRDFGGQSKRRTAYAGASTGKQIVTALVQKCRELEIAGTVERRLGLTFHSALIEDGVCYGAVFADVADNGIASIEADATVFAVGGMSGLFRKATGSRLCDGYAAGQLLGQGVEMRNLEFIQFHPTAIETPYKHMLMTEAARGEGGRLYYLSEGRRVYFMEDLYGERGNLMPRNVVAKCIATCPSQVYLDISFLGAELIHERLQEVYDLCLDYLKLDVTEESIPVGPTVHFFMGGIRVDDDHRTNVENLYAIGECASKYHGANRLGGNSLLAAVYSGRVAARAISEAAPSVASGRRPSFDAQISQARVELATLEPGSLLAMSEVLQPLSRILHDSVGILRDREHLEQGMEALGGLDGAAAALPGANEPWCGDYRAPSLLLIARAILLSALHREESRGAHQRVDFPETNEALRLCSVARCENGSITVSYVDEAGSAERPSAMGGELR